MPTGYVKTIVKTFRKISVLEDNISFHPRLRPSHSVSVSHIKIGVLNINRLRHKIHNLWTEIARHDLMVLCLCKTWLDETVSDGEVAIPGYRLFRRDRKEKLGDGICIFVHCSLTARQLPISHENLEMLWIELSLRKQKITIGCLYQPPNSSVQLWSDLEDALEGLEGSEIILLGDLNVDVLNKSDPNFGHLNSTCSILQLDILVFTPTRFSKCLDVILTNSPHVTFSNVYPVDFSDHALVFTTLARAKRDSTELTEPQKYTKRCWSPNSVADFPGLHSFNVP